MARPSMADLIATLRGLTDAKENDTTTNGVSYWTDDQLEDILDRNSSEIFDVRLVPKPQYNAGTLQYLKYYLPDSVSQHVEADLVTVVDSLGNAAPSYTYNPAYRLVTFSQSTGGTDYYIRGRSYNMNAAAYEVWSIKAAQRAELVRWRAGAHQIYEDQEWQHCMEKMREFSRRSGVHYVPLRMGGYGQINRHA